MQYIASAIDATFHASRGERERVKSQTAPGGHGWAWKAVPLCDTRAMVGISGRGLISVIDCPKCLKILEKEGAIFR